MRRIDLTNYTVELRNEEEEYYLKDGRGPFPSIQASLNALGVDPADRPLVNRWDQLSPEYQGQIELRELVEIPYEVKNSLIELLFSKDPDGRHPELRLSGIELLERDDLARKVKDCDGVLLLEEPEWLKLKTTAESTTGFGRPDVELIRRIMNAEEVEVEEKAPAEPQVPAEPTEEKP